MSDEMKELYERGRELFDKGKYMEAEGFLKEVNRINPRFADVHNKLGVIANLNNDLVTAERYFEAALILNPAYTEAALNLAITRNEMGRFEEAEHAFEQASVKDRKVSGRMDTFIAGKIANEHYKLGNIYFDLGLIDESIEEYAKALQLRNDLPDVLTRFGVALREKGKHNEATIRFRSAKEINPGYAPAWTQLALTYYLQNRPDLAIKELEDFLKLCPESKEARSLLNFLLHREA